jgi:hypothetical protein
MFDLTKAVEKFTKDGKVDIAGLKASIDSDYVNPIVASKKPNMEQLTLDAVTKAEAKIISELGLGDVKDVAGLKTYATNFSSNSDEKQIALTKALADLEIANGFKGKYDDAMVVNKDLHYATAIKGVFDTKFKTFVYSEMDLAKIGDDNPIETVVETLQAKYPEMTLNYKTSKGNGPLNILEPTADQVAEMAKAMGVTEPK